MTITTRGRRWEILHSLWIGWTFTLGFFNWIAFLYIGLRTKQRRWVLWGAIYAVPFVLAVGFGYGAEAPGEATLLGNINIALVFLMGVMSIFHAFRVRKEYLVRLNTLEGLKGKNDESLKRRLADEYGRGAQREVQASDSTIPGPEAVPDPNRGTTTFTEKATSPRVAPGPEGNSPQRVQHKVPISVPSDAKPSVTPLEVMSRDDLEYRVSSSYPFPLAFGFRSLMSIVDPRDLYREQLRVGENLLAFLGSVSMALLDEQDREEAAVNPKDYWLTGISPGDWREIIARCSRIFARYEGNPVALAVKGLNIRSEKKEKSFGANVAALIKAKNDYKHDRGPAVLEDFAAASKEVQERLRRCVEALSFSTAYPIRQVEDFDVARRDGRVVLKCLRYVGDHPSFPQEEVLFHRALPRGDLFLDLGHEAWVPLFPFMTTMTCSYCKARETYFIDAWDTKRGIARMKSFERGHTMSSAEVSEALSEWASGARSNAS